MQSISRMFEVIQLLRAAPRPLSARSGERNIRSVQTPVYCEIATLQAMRVPNEGEAGVGYSMRRGYDLYRLTSTMKKLRRVVSG